MQFIRIRLFAAALAALLFLNACNLINNSAITSAKIGTGASNNTGSNPAQVTCGISSLPNFNHDSAGFNAEPSTYRRLSLNTYPEAKCNDGTPASYTVRRGVGPGRDRWIIFLVGGELCTNAADCLERHQQRPQLTGSDEIAGDLNAQGIGNVGLLAAVPSANPDFYDASVLKIHYCSSDLWSGNKNGQGTFDPADVNSWNFKGRAILRAVIEDAKANYGLNEATEVLFGGSSAGGFGALFNLSLAKSLMPNQTRFVAFMDAGFPTNAPALDTNTGLPAVPAVYPMEDFIIEGIGLWNSEEDSFCAARATANPAAGINCFEPRSVLSSGATPIPIFIRQTLTDVNFLAKLGVPMNGQPPAPVNAALPYVENVRVLTRQSLASTDAKHSVMGIDEYSHVVIGSRSFYDNQYSFLPQVPNTTIQRQLYEYYLNPCTPKRLIH